MAGVFFDFSAFVMPALKRLKPAESVAAMQSINVAAVTPAFVTALFGTAAVCGLLGISTPRSTFWWMSLHTARNTIRASIEDRCVANVGSQEALP